MRWPQRLKVTGLVSTLPTTLFSSLGSILHYSLNLKEGCKQTCMKHHQFDAFLIDRKQFQMTPMDEEKGTWNLLGRIKKFMN